MNISREDLNRIASVVGGTLILSSIPGTPSHDVGIRYGDILLSVNGIKTPDIQAYVDARETRSDGMEVVVLRDGKEMNFSLVFKKDNEVDPHALLSGLAEMNLISSEEVVAGKKNFGSN